MIALAIFAGGLLLFGIGVALLFTSRRALALRLLFAGGGAYILATLTAVPTLFIVGSWYDERNDNESVIITLAAVALASLIGLAAGGWLGLVLARWLTRTLGWEKTSPR